MPGELQPLVSNQRIVDADGTPTQYFIRWAQQRQIDISNGISAADAQTLIDDWAKGRKIIAGTALHGGGDLSTDRTIAHDESLVVPGTYGDATHSARIVVDSEGHVAAASQVPISGGGGGGGPGMVGMYQIPGANIPGNTSDTPYPGLTFTFTPPADGLYRIDWFFFYFGDHRVRFAPRIDGAKIVGNTDDNWFSYAADERGAYKGTATLVQPLDMTAHTADLVYNVMDSTSNMTASYSYITVTPVATSF